MIVAYPVFKKIELDDKKQIEDFTKQFQPYNDFEFIDLWIYNLEANTEVSFLDGNLIVKRQDYITKNNFYTFLGTNNPKLVIKKLLQRSKEENISHELKHIPEISIKAIINDLNNFSVSEDEDNFDYILSVDELSKLEGGKYYDKRNLVNRFKKKYQFYEIRSLDLSNDLIRREILTLFYLWEEQKGKVRAETEIELEAVQKLFDIAHLCDVTGLGVYVDNVLIGVSTYHLLPGKFAGISLEKGNTNFQGIYSFLKHETAKVLRDLGCEYINYEQDLGIPGMKHAKQLWRPVFYLKKYTVTEKS